ncbi:MAG: patatin-like phospholipase family protein [Bacillota bacterium]
MQQQNRRPRVGLALGGGGARGAAHVGVLRVLEAAGISIDCIAGTSSGAMVGAAYAAGMPVDEIERIFSYVRLRDLFRPVWAADGLLDNSPLAQSVERVVGRLQVRDLRIPFAAMATDALTGEPVPIQDGPLSMALRASTAIPCLVRPVEYEGRRLIDGAVVHKVPVRLARSLGAEIVIAVDLSHPAPWRGRRVRHPLAYLLRVIEMMDHHLVVGELAEADVAIQPHVDCGSFQFHRSRAQVRAGEDAAVNALPLIRQRLAQPVTNEMAAAD